MPGGYDSPAPAADAEFEIPDRAAELDHPVEVFRAVADLGYAEAITAQHLLTDLITSRRKLR